MSEETKALTPAVAATQIAFRKATDILSTHLGIEPAAMIAVIKAQCFRGKSATNEQLAAFCSVAKDLNLNPLIPGMLYAFPDPHGGPGITPMIGPDAVFKFLSERADVLHFGAEPKFGEKGQLLGATAWIEVQGKSKPFTYTAWLEEWIMPKNPNWSGRPKHMICLRALKQCARYVINGLPPDEEELEIIRAREVYFQDRVPAPETPTSKSAMLAARILPPKDATPLPVAPAEPDPLPISPEPPSSPEPSAEEKAAIQAAENKAEQADSLVGPAEPPRRRGHAAP